jgi:hypothetical protein
MRPVSRAICCGRTTPNNPNRAAHKTTYGKTHQTDVETTMPPPDSAPCVAGLGRSDRFNLRCYVIRLLLQMASSGSHHERSRRTRLQRLHDTWPPVQRRGLRNRRSEAYLCLDLLEQLQHRLLFGLLLCPRCILCRREPWNVCMPVVANDEESRLVVDGGRCLL